MNTTSITNRFASLLDAPPWVLFILAVVITGNIVSLLVIGIHPDEAYYWTWAIYPDLSYYDHPPMVGWFLWIVDHLLGTNDVTLRLPAFVAWCVGFWVVFTVSTRLYGNRLYGWMAVSLYCLLPVFQAASHIVTPDSPLLLFTSLAFYFLFLATTTDSRCAWLATGVATGLALLSKYNAVLLPAGVFLGMVFMRRGRQQLGRWQPWAGIVLAALVFSPVVYWNYLHDWVSFSYQLGHGVQKVFRLDYLWTYVGGQLGASLLWIFIGMAIASVRLFRFAAIEESAKLYVSILVACFWFPLLFFGYAGSTAIGEVNWPAMAYLPGTILLAGMIGNFLLKASSDAVASKRRKIVAAVLVGSTLVSVLLVNVFRFPIEARQIGLGFMPTNTQLSDTFGWDDLKSRVVLFRKENDLQENCKTYLSAKQIWASMAYRFRDVDQFSVLPGMGTSQYEFWAKQGVLTETPPCMIVERLPHDRDNYAKTREWPGLGRWRLVETFVTPTSDTPRVYGFYLPAK